jgi:hypothetical protein
MINTIDLDKIEKKAWSSYFEDGLFDIFFALMFIISGIGQLIDSVFISLSILLCVVVFVLGKSFITMPRFGKVQYGRKRMAKQLKAYLILLATFIATFGIYVLSASGQFGFELGFSTVLIIMFIVIFGSLAYYLDFPRFLLYGIMFAVGEYTIRNYGDTVGPWMFFFFGAVLLVIGLYYLSEFIKNNPLPDKEVING